MRFRVVFGVELNDHRQGLGYQWYRRRAVRHFGWRWRLPHSRADWKQDTRNEYDGFRNGQPAAIFRTHGCALMYILSLRSLAPMENVIC